MDQPPETAAHETLRLLRQIDAKLDRLLDQAAVRADKADEDAWEDERIAEAEADVAAGRVVDSARVKEWIDSIGTDHELPLPTSGR